MIAIISLPGQAITEITKNLLIASEKFVPPFILHLVTTPLHILFCFIFSHKLGMGLYGIILSRGIIDILNAVIIVTYVSLTDMGKAILNTKITFNDLKKNMKSYYSDLLPAAGSTYLEFAVY